MKEKEEAEEKNGENLLRELPATILEDIVFIRSLIVLSTDYPIYGSSIMCSFY